MRIVVLACTCIYGQKPVLVEDPFALYERNLCRVVNANDLFAVEMASRIRKENQGVTVTVISVGTQEAEHMLEKMLWIGADRAIWGDTGDREWDNPDDIGRSLLRLVTEHAGSFDLLMVGNGSQDFGLGSMGPALASALGLDIHMNTVLIENIAEDEEGRSYRLRLHRKMEKGDRLIFETGTPVVLGMEGRGRGLVDCRLGDLLQDHRKRMEVVPLNPVGASGGGGETAGKKDIVFQGYFEPRPRPKKIHVPDGSLNAMERLRSMTAGTVAKRSSNMIDGDDRFVSNEFLRYLQGSHVPKS